MQNLDTFLSNLPKRNADDSDSDYSNYSEHEEITFEDAETDQIIQFSENLDDEHAFREYLSTLHDVGTNPYIHYARIFKIFFSSKDFPRAYKDDIFKLAKKQLALMIRLIECEISDIQHIIESRNVEMCTFFIEISNEESNYDFICEMIEFDIDFSVNNNQNSVICEIFVDNEIINDPLLITVCLNDNWQIFKDYIEYAIEEYEGEEIIRDYGCDSIREYFSIS